MLERYFTPEEILAESMNEENIRSWGFIVADNKEYSVTLDRDENGTKNLVFNRDYPCEIPIDKIPIASIKDIETAMKKYELMAQYSAACKRESWAKRLNDITKGNENMKVITANVGDRKFDIGVAYQKNGKVIFNSLDIVNKSYQVEEFQSMLKENRWEIEERRHRFKRELSNEEIAQKIINFSIDDSGIVVTSNDKWSVEMALATDGSVGLLLFRKNDELGGYELKSENSIFPEWGIDEIRKYVEEIMEDYERENMPDLSIQDTLPKIVEDIRKKPEYLMHICEAGLFKLRPGLELDNAHREIYAKAVEQVIKEDYSHMEEIQNYYYLMKNSPSMVMEEFITLGIRDRFKLGVRALNERVEELKKDGHEVRALITKWKGKEHCIGAVCKKDEKIVLNMVFQFNELYTPDEMREFLRKNNYTIAKQPIAAKVPLVSLPEL